MKKSKKTVVIRVKKVAPKRFQIEQRRRFLFWHFFQKGCFCLNLSPYYSTKLAAKTAIQSKGEKKGVRTVILFM